MPKTSNKQLPATMLWWLCSSFLTSDALIQVPAICTCLEGKCWPSIPRRDTNRAHFNVNNPPWRGSMINVSFSCHGLIPNLGGTAFHCKLLFQDADPVLPHKPCIISYSNLSFSFFDLFTLHFEDTSSTGHSGLRIPRAAEAGQLGQLVLLGGRDALPSRPQQTHPQTQRDLQPGNMRPSFDSPTPSSCPQHESKPSQHPPRQQPPLTFCSLYSSSPWPDSFR